MGMVFCRGCGKEIHETAPTCPLCGALQAGPAQARRARNAAKLLAWGFVWTCVFWVIALFLAGFAVGAMNPDDPGAAGERIGEALALPFLLVAFALSGLLTYLGKLPGTEKARAA